MVRDRKRGVLSIGPTETLKIKPVTRKRLKMFEPVRLEDMTMEQLLREREAAHEAEIRADYVDGLTGWRMAVRSAQLRMRKVTAEIERRGEHG